MFNNLKISNKITEVTEAALTGQRVNVFKQIPKRWGRILEKANLLAGPIFQDHTGSFLPT